jgi:hypothetical protein
MYVLPQRGCDALKHVLDRPAHPGQTVGGPNPNSGRIGMLDNSKINWRNRKQAVRNRKILLDPGGDSGAAQANQRLLDRGVGVKHLHC